MGTLNSHCSFPLPAGAFSYNVLSIIVLAVHLHAPMYRGSVGNTTDHRRPDDVGGLSILDIIKGASGRKGDASPFRPDAPPFLCRDIALFFFLFRPPRRRYRRTSRHIPRMRVASARPPPRPSFVQDRPWLHGRGQCPRWVWVFE